MQPVGVRFPRPVRVTVRFDEPLYFGMPKDAPVRPARRAATDEIMTAIRHLSGQETSDAHNELTSGG
jgi:1-acyl-sn-glycerol-3-phosphate acyltransferase